MAASSADLLREGRGEAEEEAELTPATPPVSLVCTPSLHAHVLTHCGMHHQRHAWMNTMWRALERGASTCIAQATMPWRDHMPPSRLQGQRLIVGKL